MNANLGLGRKKRQLVSWPLLMPKSGKRAKWCTVILVVRKSEMAREKGERLPSKIASFFPHLRPPRFGYRQYWIGWNLPLYGFTLQGLDLGANVNLGRKKREADAENHKDKREVVRGKLVSFPETKSFLSGRQRWRWCFSRPKAQRSCKFYLEVRIYFSNKFRMLTQALT